MINEAERPEVLREHFEECWRHFANRFNKKYPFGTKGLSKVRASITRFCGVGDQALHAWLADADRRIAGGLTEIRLKCFLDLNGYRIIEFERLPKSLRNLSELIGYGVMSPEEVAQALGYGKAQSVYRVIRQDQDGGFSKEKETKAYTLWKEKRDDLEQKKREALKDYYFDLSLEPSEPKPPQPLRLVPHPEAESSVVRPSGTLVVLKGALALLKEVRFDELSKEELAALKQSDRDVILQLSSRLMGLSSELLAIQGEK